MHLRHLADRRPGVLVAPLLVALAMVVSSCGLFDDDAPPPTTLPRPEETDIVYGQEIGCIDGVDPCSGAQSVDIYRSPAPGPNPVVIWLHGGGFIQGDKADGVSEHLQPLLDGGWDIVAANYRLVDIDGTDAFPAPLQDAKRVVRWVKANAAAEDWDAASVAALGHSAGGNLAAMLAVTSQRPELEPTDLPEALTAVDSSVVAAIAMAPVSDLAMFATAPFWTDAVARYVGCTDCPDQLAAGSVAPQVDASAAPLMLLHGVEDTVASPAQGDGVVAAFDAAGIADRVALVVISDGPELFRGHELDVERFAPLFLAFLDDARAGQL